MIDFSTFTMYVGKTKLKQNRDYIVSYSQNKKVGTAVITITGKGNYSGTVKKCHPCINTSSLKFTTEDLMQKIIPALEHEPVTVTLPVPE